MIIGITGTLGSGKDTIAEHLVKKYGFTSIGTGDIVREFAKAAGWPNTRDAQREMGNKLRREKGRGFLIKAAISRLKSKNKAITGIRQPEEAQYVRDLSDGLLIAVDAPIKMRFERMLKRKRPGDSLTLESLIEREKKEMFGQLGKNTQNISQCMKEANYHLENDGSIAELNKKVDEILKRVYGKKKIK
ncbi:MAG: AAA family ATPase [Patescibacteria group bacterium]|nr:AAA family ATPase [Patescibacteria group bacterium]